MLIFLLSLSMMISMTVAAIILLLEENAARSRIAEPVFDISTMRRLPRGRK
ncbi:hypothetical protein GCM10011491_05390 [Brucella endophytica]|uniref:Uncharacterized protein n=1 Tax=Brucella endophytica TaxID=1963359 RepID=A0A916S4T1_9HYPH|nr:hypothetical protein [Brucella endophytica]GGA81034.1 hypothetical protein GCM10011491_05390 [Brucella endophytica]